MVSLQIYYSEHTVTLVSLTGRYRVYPDSRYLKIQPANPLYQTSRALHFLEKTYNECKSALVRNLWLLVAGKKRICVHAWYLLENVGKKDKNSVNICGGCWGSLRWADICRLISTGYIIEIFFSLSLFFSLFLLHSIFNNLEKIWPRG